MKELSASPAEQPSTATSLAQAEARLRAAVRSESFENVPALLADHHRQLEQAVQAASGDSKESRRLAVQARETLDWVKANVLANRAHAQTNLDRLSNAARFLPASSRPARSWKLEG